VLRFLAEDVGQRLDVVLDAILRTLAHRGTTHRVYTSEAPIGEHVPDRPLEQLPRAS
jgi:hypothetical protein